LFLLCSLICNYAVTLAVFIFIPCDYQRYMYLHIIIVFKLLQCYCFMYLEVLNKINKHAFCIERSHSATADGNAVKVESSLTLRAFSSVAARSAGVDSRKLHISYVQDDRAANYGWPRGESAIRGSPRAVRTPLTSVSSSSRTRAFWIWSAIWIWPRGHVPRNTRWELSKL